MPDKASTRIQLCGRLAVELGGRELTGKLPGGQARVLFTYLVVNRALPARREELIEALWPWRTPAGADASLSALLSRLRAVLGSEVLSGRSDVRLQLPHDAWIDLEAAEEAIHRAESAVAQHDWARGWGPSLIALFTARRGFLPGEDLPWAQEHRRRLEEIDPEVSPAVPEDPYVYPGTNVLRNRFGIRDPHELARPSPPQGRAGASQPDSQRLQPRRHSGLPRASSPGRPQRVTERTR